LPLEKDIVEVFWKIPFPTIEEIEAVLRAGEMWTAWSAKAHSMRDHLGGREPRSTCTHALSHLLGTPDATI
jgi:hypothetical protein